MIVDGKAIAEDKFGNLKKWIVEKGVQPRLLAFTAAPNKATKQFLAIKKRRAEEVGITLSVKELEGGCTTGFVIEALEEQIKDTDGVVIQLPFPNQVDIADVLRVLPSSHDVDVIGGEATTLLSQDKARVLPPVVSAIRSVAQIHNVSLEDKRVVIVGDGRLVGAPSALWLRGEGVDVTVLNSRSGDIKKHTSDADILILGAGVPNLIQPDMVKDGVVIFDAGTSEEGGKLVGDADPGCAKRASLFTPVPGGIGPVAVAALFENLLTLAYNFEA